MVKRIKVKDTVSCGIGQVMPGNPKRPDMKIELHEHGVLVFNERTEEVIIVPWNNLVEVVLDENEYSIVEEDSDKPKRGRPRK